MWATIIMVAFASLTMTIKQETNDYAFYYNFVYLAHDKYKYILRKVV